MKNKIFLIPQYILTENRLFVQFIQGDGFYYEKKPDFNVDSALKLFLTVSNYVELKQKHD